MKKLFEGDIAEIYNYDENKVLKLFKIDVPENTKEICEFEFNNLLILFKNKLPVPKPYHTIEIKNRFGFIMQKINGFTLSELISSDNIKQYSSLLGNLHKKIHSVKINNENIPYLKECLFRNLNNLNDNFLDIKNDLLNIFNSLHESVVITHGDFAPNNIIIKNNRPYIIDWLDMMLGDKYADISRTILFLIDDYNPNIKRYFKNNDEKKVFILNYLNTYFENKINYEKLVKWFIINCVFEYIYMKNNTIHTEFSKIIFNYIYEYIKNSRINFFDLIFQ